MGAYLVTLESEITTLHDYHQHYYYIIIITHLAGCRVQILHSSK